MVKKKKPPDKSSYLPPDLTRKRPNYVTVKTSLKSIIKDDDTLVKINELVIKCNDIVSDTYQFIRLYCLYQYHNNKDIPKLNKTFIGTCIKAIGQRDPRGKQTKDKTLLNVLSDFYKKEYQPIYKHKKHDLKGLTYITPYICRTIETCLKNNLKEHFIIRLLRFINTFADEYYELNYGKDKEHNEEYLKHKKKLLRELKKAILSSKHDDIPDEFKLWFDKHKNSLVPKKFTKSIAYDCHVNPFKYIKYSFYMNSEYEKKNIENKKKLVSASKLEKYDTINKEISLLKKQLHSITQKIKYSKNYVSLLTTFINWSLSKYIDSKKHENKQYLINKTKKSIMDNQFNLIPKETKYWFRKHKSSIIPSNTKEIIKKDYKNNKSKYDDCVKNLVDKLTEYHDTIKKDIENKQKSVDKTKNKDKIDKINKEIKELNSDIIKLFQPLSLRNSCIPKYLTIDTASLMNLFSERGKKGKMLGSLKENQQLVWSMYFKTNKSIFKQKGYVFNHTIQTDGIGCSLLFCIPSLVDKKYDEHVNDVNNDFHYIDDLSKDQIEILKTKKLVSVDPGKYNLVYMYDDEGNKLRYTSCQRDTESLAKRNRRIIQTNKIKKKIVELESELSNYCCKTVDYKKFKEFIKAKHKVNKKVKKFYQEQLYRKLNWRTKTYRQKSEDKFIHRIEKTFDNNFVIIYGDWSRSTQMAGLPSTMGIGLRKLMAKKYLTLSINEFNTSKKCCNCWQDIENKEINGDKKFRLLVCKNCHGKQNTGSLESEKDSVFRSTNSFLTRDINSCINMLSIAKHMIYNDKKRPKEFCRIEKTNNKKKKKKVVKKRKITITSIGEKGGKSVVFTG